MIKKLFRTTNNASSTIALRGTCLQAISMIINIIITHSERALFNLNARVEARGTIVPKAVGRGYYGPERQHKGI